MTLPNPLGRPIGEQGEAMTLTMARLLPGGWTWKTARRVSPTLNSLSSELKLWFKRLYSHQLMHLAVTLFWLGTFLFRNLACQ